MGDAVLSERGNFQRWGTFRIPHSAFRIGLLGQTTLEYLLVLAAILLAIIFGVRQGGPIRTGVDTVMNDAATVISGLANDVSSRF
jgi:hypothetical protein